MKRPKIFWLLYLISLFSFSSMLGAEGDSTAGTIWDHVPEGGSIRAESDGGWTILDKDSNAVGKVEAGQTAPTPPATPAPAFAADTGAPDLTGTVWEHVPQGGAIRAEADGTWTILDANMNPVGTYPPPQTGAAAGTGSTPSVTTGGTGQQPLPPLVTPMPGGGVMTSQNQTDGSWTHHYRREDPDGNVIDYEIGPEDDAFPHEDPRFWKPGQTGPDRIVTRRENGSTITSVRNRDGTWTHTFRSVDGNISYRLRPDDELYPKDDPRFQDPNKKFEPLGSTSFGLDSSNPLGSEIGQDFAQAQPHQAEHHFDE